jgi:hypothetical protein
MMPNVGCGQGHDGDRQKQAGEWEDPYRAELRTIQMIRCRCRPRRRTQHRRHCHGQCHDRSFPPQHAHLQWLSLSSRWPYPCCGTTPVSIRCHRASQPGNSQVTVGCEPIDLLETEGPHRSGHIDCTFGPLRRTPLCRGRRKTSRQSRRACTGGRMGDAGAGQTSSAIVGYWRRVSCRRLTLPPPQRLRARLLNTLADIRRAVGRSTPPVRQRRPRTNSRSCGNQSASELDHRCLQASHCPMHVRRNPSAPPWRTVHRASSSL